MSNYCCECRRDCTGIAVVASLVIGIITGMLRFMGVITVGTAFLWVVFGIAIVYLGILLITSAFTCNNYSNNCICRGYSALLTGILGSILTSVILLAIPFAVTSVVGAIITGGLTAALTLLVVSVVCIIKCRLNCYND